MGKWYRVGEHMPEDDIPAGVVRYAIGVLVTVNVNGCRFVKEMTRVRCDVWSDRQWSSDEDYITHWMPMPPPAKEEE